MNLTPWRRSTGELLEQMKQEMDQVFTRFFGESETLGQTQGKAWAPRVDVEECDKALTVKVDLPGVEAENLEISYAEGSLIVQGENKEQREEPGKTYHCTERMVGRFFRSIPMPPSIDPDRIEARSHQGVLIVTVPKKGESQAKKIPIKTEG